CSSDLSWNVWGDGSQQEAPGVTSPSTRPSSISPIAATLGADAELGSNRYPSHSRARRRASSMPTTRWPKHSTCASLESTERSTENESCAVTARTPGTLFAELRSEERRVG